MKFNKKGYVYFIYDIRGRLCYIGQTSWLQSRMMDHFGNKLISRVTYLTYDCKETAEFVEAYYIDKFNPFLNVTRYPKKVTRGYELKESFIVRERELVCFETDTSSRYCKMSLEYPEFPINKTRLPRGTTYMNTLHTYKVFSESNPQVCMMFYEYHGLVKVVVGKTMKKHKVTTSDLEKVFKSLPEKENTVNTFTTGLCSQIPKRVIDNLEHSELLQFMKSKDTLIVVE